MPKSNRSNAVYKIGFWSAVLTALLSIAWAAAFAFQFSTASQGPWGGVEETGQSFDFVTDMINLVFALPLSWTFIVMMVSVHFFVPEDKKIWTMIGLAFAIIYAVMADINYLIQLVTVRASLLAGETEGLGLFVIDNMHSVFWALANSYAIQSIGLFFAAWAIEGGRPARWIRALWIAVGVTAPFQFAFSLGLIPMAIALPVLGVWIVGLPLSTVLLAALFRHPERLPPQLTSTPQP